MKIKKVKCRARPYKWTYKYYWVLEDENVKLKSNYELINKYYENDKPRTYTKSNDDEKSTNK